MPMPHAAVREELSDLCQKACRPTIISLIPIQTFGTGHVPTSFNTLSIKFSTSPCTVYTKWNLPTPPMLSPASSLRKGSANLILTHWHWQQVCWRHCARVWTLRHQGHKTAPWSWHLQQRHAMRHRSMTTMHRWVILTNFLWSIVMRRQKTSLDPTLPGPLIVKHPRLQPVNSQPAGRVTSPTRRLSAWHRLTARRLASPTPHPKPCTCVGSSKRSAPWRGTCACGAA